MSSRSRVVLRCLIPASGLPGRRRKQIVSTENLWSTDRISSPSETCGGSGFGWFDAKVWGINGGGAKNTTCLGFGCGNGEKSTINSGEWCVKRGGHAGGGGHPMVTFTKRS